MKIAAVLLVILNAALLFPATAGITPYLVIASILAAISVLAFVITGENTETIRRVKIGEAQMRKRPVRFAVYLNALHACISKPTATDVGDLHLARNRFGKLCGHYAFDQRSKQRST